MKRYRGYFKTLLFIFSLILTSSCASDVIIEETTGNLLGIVADKTTGASVPVVSLTLEPGGKSTVTGSDGSFSFKDLEEGKYTITYRKEGYKDGESAVTVAAGIDSEAHLLIERIPAVITTDQEVLDFGDSNNTSTLSFKIVNPGYETLMWSISYDKECKWLKSVLNGAGEYSGKLASGKTETLVVIIDRDELPAGLNETVVVITSNNGSSEIRIKAIGQEKISPALNITNVENLTSSSVMLNGEITNSGTPAYTERGFVYSSEDATPTIENATKIVVEKSNSYSFSTAVSGLTPKTFYYVRAYAMNKKGTAYGEVIRILGPDYYTYDNLMVQRYDAGYYTWTNAKKACENLVLGGYSDWRLPTLSELNTIGESLTTFDEYSSSYYWSSTYYGTVSDTGVGTVKCYSIYNIVEKYTNYCEDNSWYTYPVRCVRTR